MMLRTVSSNPVVCVIRLRSVIGSAALRGEVEIAVHAGIEVEFALLDQLHRRRPGE